MPAGRLCLIGLGFLLVPGCSAERERACRAEGFEPGGTAFQECVDRKYAEAYRRIQKNRYVPRNSR